MSMPAIAEDIDDDVLIESMAISDRQGGDAHGGIGIIPIDVENRRLHGSGKIGGVWRRARFFRGVVNPI